MHIHGFGFALLLACAGLRAAQPQEQLLLEARILVPLRVASAGAALADGSRVLVLALHGRGGDPDALLRALRPLAGDGVVLAALQGPYPQGEGFRWFHPSLERRVWAVSDQQVVELVRLALRELRTRYPVSRAVLLGHSEGAGLAYLVAARARQEVDGLVCFGAGDPKDVLTEAELGRLKDLDLFLANGREDPLVAFPRAAAAAATFQGAGARVRFAPYEGGHELRGGPLREAAAWIRRPAPAASGGGASAPPPGR